MPKKVSSNWPHEIDWVRRSLTTTPSKRGAEGRITTVRLEDTMPDRRYRDGTVAIRVSNISENVQENDLQELFKWYGHVARIFFPKNKVTGLCKGFAFVHYYKEEEAARAIATLNGYGYDHLILSVKWAKS
ncbi:eukaryotic translation initiation factor 3 subunit G [Eurytemora carolleeae]|uniref:eukaryotic translation initiation factor 3 subunit G n=1 Tax=Eurytemora carolleeae TaxID=1294199 RepID=UPI000C762169|nr:eukaryotic translation initiation factor 3 subunit G [Eurytemora carolleeae]|eukprot:XP_023341096.1 eukaryotic translation initiation factor 3 subunit G-like [Eurytemora affinis]